MKVTYKWLREYVDIPVDAKELKNIFPKIGLEVDDFYYMGKDLENVVVAYVEELKKHPDADKLSVCQVNDGNEVLQVICGAPNVKKGQKVVLAKIGACLPGDFKIKKAKLRGVESFGMLCSEKELGLSEESSGIMVLPEDAEIGKSFAEYYGLDDYVYSLETFANRSDHMGVLGIARDLSVYFDKDFKLKDLKVENDIDEKVFEVIIENPEKCPRYLGRYVENVNGGETPVYIKNRLRACDIRPISFLVDITNYVMLETGHPMHAFDARYFPEKKVYIKNAKKEKFPALNEKEYDIDENDLVIANEKEAVALAGIIGGKNSEVKDDTNAIFFESAYFEPKTILKTSRKLGLRTDSSIRFEKDANPDMAEYALRLASYILKSNIKDSKFYAIIDNYPGKKERRKVYFNKEKLYDYLGFEIPEKEVDRILKRLPLEYAGDNYYYVDNSRKDINIEVDVVEEIAKFFGYDNIIPEDLTVAITPYENKQKFLFDFASKMATLGFNEVKNFSLTGEKNEDSVEVINPLNEELAYMRTNMLSGLLKVLDYNEKRGMNEHFYAESGKVYKMKDGKYFEKYVLCALAKGNVFDGIFDKKQADYYYMKGIVENILSGYSLEFLPNDDNDKLHPGVSAKIVIDETLIGYVGKVHPLIYGKDAYYFEIYPESVPEKSSKIVKDISQNPSVKFDLSLLVPDTLKYGDVLNLILDMNVKELESIKVYDFYKGENIPEGKFSITFRMLFNDTEKTLNDKKVNKIVGNILKRLEKGGITLRDK